MEEIRSNFKPLHWNQIVSTDKAINIAVKEAGQVYQKHQNRQIIVIGCSDSGMQKNGANCEKNGFLTKCLSHVLLRKASENAPRIGIGKIV